MEKLSTSERSPLSPTRWPPDAFAWPRSLAAFALVAVAFGAGLVLASIIVTRSGITPATGLTLTWSVLEGQLASYVVLVPTLLAILPWLARRSLAQLGLRWPDARAIGISLLGALGMYVVTIGLAGVQFALTHEKPEEAATSLFTSTHDPLLAMAFGVLAVVIAPFVEELMFRGFLFNTILRYTPVWAAATLSGIVFGLSHGSLTAFVPLAGSGIVLAYVYYVTGSLPASMLTHALFNAINVALIALGKAT